MTAAYKILYDYAMILINDDHQARKIVDFALLEAAGIAVKDRDAEKAQEVLISTIREKCRMWKGRKLQEG